MKRQELIDELPAGLTRIVGRIISYRVSKENAITKNELLSQVRVLGYANTKNLGRKIRVAVHELRNQGVLICSSSSGAGYWMAANYSEAAEFFGEMKGRGTDIMKTARIMEQAADKQFVDKTIPMFG
jgi:hypothetical protein